MTSSVDAEAVARAVWEAAKAGDAAKLRNLLERRTPAPVHYQEVGYSPLHNAAGKGHTECVRLLIEHGADIRAKASGGYTALHDAARNGHVESLRLLIQAGAVINEKNNFGGTPLHGASFYGRSDCVEALLNAGADVGAKTNDGKTASDLASRDDVKQMLAAAKGGIPVRIVTIVEPDAQHLRQQIDKLQAQLRSAYNQIDTLEGQLAATRKKTDDYEAELKEHRDLSRKEAALVELLKSVGWRLVEGHE